MNMRDYLKRAEENMNEGAKGKKEFEKMKKYVNDFFVKNTKFKFTVKTLPSIGSFTIKGDMKEIEKVLKNLIADSPLKLLADYGYTFKRYPSQKTILLKNFDMFLDAKWKEIWKH